ncbi:DUF202 domain-containing protein [Nesterenkonia salmonea]|uniref:DUF202 domain-containing protein n=1 Tax=Nesterenkonia salmonea TaxID=1804987 RepID=A0A5R9BE89_9MICC|nr:DUF202 domain-containing protein [Nesterenkonia salmonea]TLP98589.1 DUF202 domain-containing protein [Nesterenkonia salmonea]
MAAAALTHQDPGVQPERTLLSWTRTALLLLVVAGFMLRWAPYHGVAVLGLFCGAGLVAAGISLSQRRRLGAAVKGINQEHYPPALATVAALAMAVIGLGLAALVMLAVT